MEKGNPPLQQCASGAGYHWAPSGSLSSSRSGSRGKRAEIDGRDRKGKSEGTDGYIVGRRWEGSKPGRPLSAGDEGGAVQRGGGGRERQERQKWRGRAADQGGWPLVCRSLCLASAAWPRRRRRDKTRQTGRVNKLDRSGESEGLAMGRRTLTSSCLVRPVCLCFRKGRGAAREHLRVGERKKKGRRPQGPTRRARRGWEERRVHYCYRDSVSLN